MDSMRSLNTSLPRASPAKNDQSENHAQLLVAFKAAALSVTQLYKTAATEQKQTRTEGYEDALYELLDFLDKEDIGLGDGEGWRIRSWINERINVQDAIPTESDDESATKNDRGSSPAAHRSHSAPVPHLSPTIRSSRPASPARSEAAQPPPPANPASTSTTSEDIPIEPLPPAFIFRGSHAYPQPTNMEPDMDMSDTNRPSNDVSATSHVSTPPITVTRPSRNSSRHNSPRSIVRATNPLSRSTGSKRKTPPSHEYGEFFDILNNNNGFNGGGKRGRFV